MSSERDVHAVAPSGRRYTPETRSVWRSVDHAASERATSVTATSYRRPGAIPAPSSSATSVGLAAVCRCVTTAVAPSCSAATTSYAPKSPPRRHRDLDADHEELVSSKSIPRKFGYSRKASTSAGTCSSTRTSSTHAVPLGSLYASSLPGSLLRDQSGTDDVGRFEYIPSLVPPTTGVSPRRVPFTLWSETQTRTPLPDVRCRGPRS